MKVRLPPTEYAAYTSAWQDVADAGLRELNLDAWAAGWRYLSLTAVTLTAAEAAQLRAVARDFAGLFEMAVDGILADPDWWSALAWPWSAIELARQEPPHPGRRATLYGRLDCLLDPDDGWQVIEYNADTPSGGREATGLEPAIARLYPDCRRSRTGLARQLVATIRARIALHQPVVGTIGVVSSHSWLEDMAQATWLAWHLRRAGLRAIVGDVTDLAVDDTGVRLRGERIQALYRFYPVERLYRHAIFAGLCEAAIDGRVVLLNGLRGFLAQSKACMAWLWCNRARFSGRARVMLERHLPATLPIRDPGAAQLLPSSVVKHVNGREGDSVVFGRDLVADAAGWEARLLEGGYVVQRAIASPALADVEVDDVQRRVNVCSPRYACVGAFVVGGRFGGCYTRLDGPITTARASYAATLLERA